MPEGPGSGLGSAEKPMGSIKFPRTIIATAVLINRGTHVHRWIPALMYSGIESAGHKGGGSVRNKRSETRACGPEQETIALAREISERKLAEIWERAFGS